MYLSVLSGCLVFLRFLHLYFYDYETCISSVVFIFAGALNLALAVSVIASVPGPPRNQKIPGQPFHLEMRMMRVKESGPGSSF